MATSAGFKAKPAAKNPNDLLSTLTQSKARVNDNPLYQAIFQFINLFSNYVNTNNALIATMETQISNIDTSKEEQISPFLFMGSS